MIRQPENRGPVPNKERRRRKRLVSLFLGLLLVLVALFVLIILISGIIALWGQIPLLGYSVAVLEVDEPIYEVRDYIKFLHKQRDNTAVRAIVVYLNSPGGVVGAVQELYSEIDKIRQEGTKPIIASMGNIATSGAYYLACATDKVYANPGTITGSIGVLLNLPNWEELIQKIGLKFEVIKSGKHKDIGSPTRPMTPEEQKILSQLIDDSYHQFLEVVVENRRQPIMEALRSKDILSSPSITNEQLLAVLSREIADGRIFTGRQGLGYGLVDQLGNLQDAIDYAAQVSGLKPRPHVITSRRHRPLWELLLGKFRSFQPTSFPTLEYIPVIGK